MIEIIPMGGYSEVGRNSTMIKYGDECVILDLGLMLENYIGMQKKFLRKTITYKDLIRFHAGPDITQIEKELKQLQGVIISHGHLDHVGAVPYYFKKLGVNIYGSPYTMSVLRKLTPEQKIKEIDEKIKAKEPNTEFKIGKKFKIEFIHTTHSIPQTVIIAVKTKEGTVVYANDYKFDDESPYDKKPNYPALKKLKNVKALIIDSLYSKDKGKTPSEKHANEMLKKLLTKENTKNKNIITTTFSSHIHRIKTLLKIARKLKRQPVIIGRSLAKYLDAAEESKIFEKQDDIKMIKFGGELRKYFNKEKNTKNKFYIVTGHQGEEDAVLNKITKQKLFPYEKGDLVVFSCKVIPVEQNIIDREKLENELEKRGVKIYKDYHVSGHAYSEDHKKLIELVKPEHIIPTHGSIEMLEEQKQHCIDMGVKPEQIHILQNFERIQLQ